GSDPKRFFVPPYMGKQGWVGVRIDYKVKWDQLAAILKDGYQMSAPKKSRTRASTGIAPKRAAKPARRKKAPGRIRYET
ncbi:MAG TPA: hypothetical protein VLI44_01825, partial [Sporolactobacillaceae bacterium]|nr:hypothetical protein [Sporolactobacillaceae bacterium]